MQHNIQALGLPQTHTKDAGSSSFLLNHSNVIDGGNLLLPLQEKSIILDTVWLTHSHLDHIIDLAYILDNYFEIRTKTLKIMALPSTIEALKKHFFNNVIWPDFSKIPLSNNSGMVLSYYEIKAGESYRLDDRKSIEPFLGDHTVESLGYIVRESNSAILISADTHSLEHVVSLVEGNDQITSLVLECSFPVRMKSLAERSKHLTPEYLFEGIKHLEGKGLKLYINHIKPKYEDEIIKEIEVLKGTWDVNILQEGDTLHF